MKIRKMNAADESDVLAMMRTFYASSAVYTNGSEEIFRRNFLQCIDSSSLLDGFILENNGTIDGYAMLAHSFNTEFGQPCIWIEDIYLEPKARGNGFASAFLSFVKDTWPGKLLRLEVENENKLAVHTYEKNQFQFLPYREMYFI